MGFEGVDRARARATQAAASPVIWSVFPARIERRRKIFRCGGEFEVFIFATHCRGSHSRSELASRVALNGKGHPQNESRRNDHRG